MVNATTDKMKQRTPFGITVDHQSIQDDTVTIRYRDTQKQDRLSIAEIKPLISNSINTI